MREAYPLVGTVRARDCRAERASASPCRTDRQHKASLIVAYLSAILRLAGGASHELSRPGLFRLIDTYLRANIATIRPAPALAAEFGISERTFHRIFADRATTFERHVLHLRVELFKDLLRQPSLTNVPIARLAHQCGFADAAHATRTFKDRFGGTPRDFRASPPGQRTG
jgi:transcriptional regulator GlxA family with amidase domain